MVSEGETFQVRDRGINNGGIDFLVDNEFLEWHPIALMKKVKGKNGRGDIPEQEADSYKHILSELSQGEKGKFQEDYKKVLSINYRNKRQESVDNSGYAGTNVALATDVQELYNFISQHSDLVSLPSYDDFRREFNQKIKYVKGFKVQKQEKAEEVLEVAV